MMKCGRFTFSFDQPVIMGVVNVTPDSFSDGGRFQSTEQAIEQGLRLIEQGAAIIDIGGESTRPGAQSLSPQAELDRVIPVIQGLLGAGAAISIDTRKPQVMRAAIDCGVDMVNDVEGFRDSESIAAVATSSECGVCVMHMLGTPQSMQVDPVYSDVLAEVSSWLGGRVDALRSAGIAAERVLIDPGIGFGKRLHHNLSLLATLDRLRAIAPVLVGVSRKSMLGELTGRSVDQRLAASLSAMLAAVARGASVVRVHDVAEARDALVVWEAIQDAAGQAQFSQMN
jgi:dihydropteroate synthase